MGGPGAVDIFQGKLESDYLSPRSLRPEITKEYLVGRVTSDAEVENISAEAFCKYVLPGLRIGNLGSQSEGVAENGQVGNAEGARPKPFFERGLEPGRPSQARVKAPAHLHRLSGRRGEACRVRPNKTLGLGAKKHTARKLDAYPAKKRAKKI